MSRPIKQRLSKTYTRDIESLTRLRVAISFDDKLPKAKVKEATSQIDEVIEHLAEFRKMCEGAA